MALDSQIIEAAASLAVSPSALGAVLKVECGSVDPSRWLDPRGRAWLRVEAHRVLAWPGRAPSTGSGDSLRVDGPKPWQGHKIRKDGVWQAYHGEERAKDGPDEWDALDAASFCLKSRDSAMQCASWGPGQVMGEYWREMGYSSVYEMARYSQTKPLTSVTRFLAWKKDALAALQKLDFLAFAKVYNGAGKAPEYAANLQTAFKALG